MWNHELVISTAGSNATLCRMSAQSSLPSAKVKGHKGNGMQARVLMTKLVNLRRIS